MGSLELEKINELASVVFDTPIGVSAFLLCASVESHAKISKPLPASGQFINKPEQGRPEDFMSKFLTPITAAALLLVAASAQATTITMTDPTEGAAGYPSYSYVNPKPSSKAQVHIIGVYYGKDTAKVHVSGKVTKPITLVLSSYEKTAWVIDGASRARIGTIILNGFNQSTVTGQSIFAKVVTRTGVNTKTGQANFWSACAYQWPLDDQGCDTPSLVKGVQGYTGTPITSFTGDYQSNDFTVNLAD